MQCPDMLNTEEKHQIIRGFSHGNYAYNYLFFNALPYTSKQRFLANS
jgi:hypothetical protein